MHVSNLKCLHGFSLHHALPYSVLCMGLLSHVDAALQHVGTSLVRSLSSADKQALQQVSWTPTRDAKQGQAVPARVLPLTNMTLQLLVDHIEDVESLWGLPDVLKARALPAAAHMHAFSMCMT